MVLLNEKHVFVETPTETKESVLQFLAQTAQMLQITTDDSAVLASFNERESQGSTGMMDGFAIPHAKSAAIKEASILIVKTKNPIEWDSLDGKPTEMIIALLIPEEEAGTTHLKLLSKVARLLMKDEFKTQLKELKTAAEIAEYVNQQLIEE
ncbi:fructose PTS transporter subunit IIA [Candidatus Enterococcus ikei]|uniref:PTS sugar transporter subunit IIA n=1 Tax=Candidatus Enterococcus ikei TaxID=2815326 RepID=A0ABS3H1Y9_9ENTE|nr:fructose PTS transporter subunit IIA [Enterococcus sp. DIV0869a]MBO0441559.1 PTS sugar transporter subunit IIA [Enterococcus sp. DIV0869a]